MDAQIAVLPLEKVKEISYCSLHSNQLDTSFAQNGFFQLDINNANNIHYYSMGLLDKDSLGRLYIVGNTHNGNHRDLVITQISDKGELESTFGNNGIKLLPLGVDNLPQAMDIENDLIHISSTGGGNRRILQTDLEGNLTSDFGISGISLNPNPTSQDGLFVSKDGKVYATGHRTGPNRLTATRFNTDGSVDTTFANSGYLVSGASSDEFGAGFAFSPSQNEFYMFSELWLGGGSGFDFSISRYTLDGALDLTFNSTGRRTLDYNNTNNRGRRLDFDNSHNLYFSGTNDGGSALVIKLLTDGSVDTTFGTHGFQTFSLGTAPLIKKIIFNPDNSALLLLETTLSGLKQIAIAKMLPNGDLDNDFYDAGYLVLPWPENQDARLINAILDNENRLLLLTDVNNGANTDIGLVRFCR